ncbi:MAG: HAD hydrolase-like protein [Bacteroides sp.]|nr:HAD hydrolase-like protein [Bacteroides sp.]
MFEEDIKRFLRRHHYRGVTPVAALIDMDGTLYDSMPLHSAAWHRMVTELGIHATREEFFLYEGRTGASTINIIFQRAYGRDATPEEIKELYRRKTDYFNEFPKPGRMPGALELMNILREAGIKRVLVTGSGQHSLIDRLANDFPGIFTSDMMITGNDVIHGKPHPEPFIKAMQRARVSPSASIAIENAPLGVESADRAGAFTIAVTTGPIPREEFVRAGAAVIFDSMPEAAGAMPHLLAELFTTANTETIII